MKAYIAAEEVSEKRHHLIVEEDAETTEEDLLGLSPRDRREVEVFLKKIVPGVMRLGSPSRYLAGPIWGRDNVWLVRRMICESHQELVEWGETHGPVSVHQQWDMVFK